MTEPPTVAEILERLRDINVIRQGTRLQPEAARVLLGVLERAMDVLTEGTVRDQDAARFILTGSWTKQSPN